MHTAWRGSKNISQAKTTLRPHATPVRLNFLHTAAINLQACHLFDTLLSGAGESLPSSSSRADIRASSVCRAESSSLVTFHCVCFCYTNNPQRHAKSFLVCFLSVEILSENFN